MFRHFDKKKRFEWKENEIVSFVSYLERDGRFILYHSEVPVEHRGKGIGRKMVEKDFRVFGRERYCSVIFMFFHSISGIRECKMEKVYLID